MTKEKRIPYIKLFSSSRGVHNFDMPADDCWSFHVAG